MTDHQAFLQARGPARKSTPECRDLDWRLEADRVRGVRHEPALDSAGSGLTKRFTAARRKLVANPIRLSEIRVVILVADGTQAVADEAGRMINPLGDPIPTSL